MEEVKNQKMGVVQNNGPKEKEEQTQKLSYEQLNEVCSQLYQQNQNLVKQVQQLNMSNMFKRLDYLFEVLKAEAVIKDPEFIGNCVQEIKEAMTLPSKEEEQKED